MVRPLPVILVNAPVLAVVAPTVPLMLKDAAVPVIFVPTKAEGVPRAGVTSVGLVRVLLVRVSVPAKVDSVPVVGRVSAVLAVAVNDCVNAPACVRLPAMVMVLALAMPVPPLAAGSMPVTPVVRGMPVAFANNCVSVDLRSAVSAALWISTVSAASGTVFAV